MNVTLVCGCPASGKSTETQKLADAGYTVLNRDSIGGTIAGLLPKLETLLKLGHSVVLDNLFPTASSRQPFIKLAQKYNTEIDCRWVATSIEDAQINALHRMWQRHGRLFLDPSSLKGLSDPNMIPIAVFFKYKQEFERPTTDEGFKSVTKIIFTRQHHYSNKALILDYDQTLRDVKNDYHYPTNVNEVNVMSGRSGKLKQFKADGYIIAGVSNQSGISKGILSHADAIACFNETNTQLGVNIDYHFCPHSVPPNCYCRKPQSGLGVLLIEKYKLDPCQCIMVGDQTTDRTFASRLNMQFQWTHDFFND